MDSLVSVIVPCYNHELYVRETIDSILNLNYSPIELIMVNDGSSDRTDAVIQQLLPKCRLKFERVLYQIQENKGLIETLNGAIKLCTGEYVKIIASDDTLEPNLFDESIDLMKRENLFILFVNLNIINQESQVIRRNLPGVKGIGIDFNDIRDLTLERALDFNRFFGPAYIAKTEVFLKVGQFDSEILIEDWEYMLRCIEAKIPLGYLPKPLVNYREHEANSWKRVFFILDHNLKILSKYKPIGNHKKRLGVQYHRVIKVLLTNNSITQGEWNQLRLSMKLQQFSIIDFFPSMIRTFLNFYKLKLKTKN